MARTMWSTRILILATLAGLGSAACSSIRVGGTGDEPGGSGTVGLPGGPVGGIPRPPGPSGSSPQPGTAAAGMETRTICRSESRPSGWIAVDYVDGGSRCPKATASASERATSGVVIARYSNQPVGALMEVCANQVLPRDWHWESGEAQEQMRCPGAASEGRPTVRVMRRVR